MARTGKPRRVFAVKVGGFVELRVGFFPPKLVKDRVEREWIEDVEGYWTTKYSYYPNYGYERVYVEPQKVDNSYVLETKSYEGGKLIDTFTPSGWSKFARKWKISSKFDGVYELPEHLAMYVIDPQWRKKYMRSAALFDRKPKPKVVVELPEYNDDDGYNESYSDCDCDMCRESNY